MFTIMKLKRALVRSLNRPAHQNPSMHSYTLFSDSSQARLGKLLKNVIQYPATNVFMASSVSAASNFLEQYRCGSTTICQDDGSDGRAVVAEYRAIFSFTGTRLPKL